MELIENRCFNQPCNSLSGDKT